MAGIWLYSILLDIPQFNISLSCQFLQPGITNYDECELAIENIKVMTILQYVLVLQQNIAEFLLRSEVKTGRCYASCNFAIGRFDREGGVMRFCGRDDIQLVIPPGCLNKEQMIYMKVFTDSLSDKHLASPVVECGPNGLQTKVITLFFCSTFAHEGYNWPWIRET